MSSVENLVFGVTEVNTAGIAVDDENLVNGNVSISAPNGTNTVYFVVGNPDGLTLTPDKATLVSDADGSSSNAPYVLVYEVDTSLVARDGGDIVVAIAVVEDAREEVSVTVTVTVGPRAFGLYVENGPDLDKIDDSPILDLNDAFDWLAANAVDNTDYVILLDEDDGLTHYGSKAGSIGVTVTLRGLYEERTVTYKAGTFSGGYSNGLIEISAGTAFVLGENITLDGEETELYTSTNGGGSLVCVNRGGRFVMKPGSKITRSVAVSSGAVSLKGYNDSNAVYFTMEGGSISDNKCGAVKAASTSTTPIMVMEDGEICNNGSYYAHAGVYLTSYYDFTMRGGRISGNKGRGVDLQSRGTFRMEGGEISDNGKPTKSGPYELNTGISSTDESYVVTGAGVYLLANLDTAKGNFIMTGGKIVDNGTPDALGSGIFQEDYCVVTLDGPIDMSGNSINVSSRSNSVRSPIVVGANFENLAGDPITVDMTATYYTITTAATIQTHWKASPAPSIVTVAKLNNFTPGKVGRFDNSNFRFTIYASSYTINPTTGVLVSIP
jgi:hypothetical protein